MKRVLENTEDTSYSFNRSKGMVGQYEVSFDTKEACHLTSGNLVVIPNFKGEGRITTTVHKVKNITRMKDGRIGVLFHGHKNAAVYQPDSLTVVMTVDYPHNC